MKDFFKYTIPTLSGLKLKMEKDYMNYDRDLFKMLTSEKAFTGKNAKYYDDAFAMAMDLTKRANRNNSIYNTETYRFDETTDCYEFSEEDFKIKKEHTTRKCTLQTCQLKAIPLPEFINSITQAEDFKLKDKINLKLNKMGFYHNHIENINLSIDFNMKNVKNLYVDSGNQSNLLQQFLYGPKFVSFNSVEIKNKIISFFNDKKYLINDVKDGIKNIDLNCSLARTAVNYEMPNSDSYDKLKKEIATIIPKEFEYMFSPDSTQKVYIDLYNKMAYVQQNAILKFNVDENDKGYEDLQRLNIYFSYLHHVMQSIHLALKYKTDNGYVVNEDDANFLKQLVDVTDIGIKFTRTGDKFSYDDFVFSNDTKNNVVTIKYDKKDDK